MVRERKIAMSFLFSHRPKGFPKMVLISAAISVVNCLQSALQLIPAHLQGFIILNNTIIFLGGETVSPSRCAIFILPFDTNILPYIMLRSGSRTFHSTIYICKSRITQYGFYIDRS